MALAPVDYDAALRACARGDENAFQRLYENEAPRMLALGLSMLGQRASAEELLRDTFTLIWKNADSFDEGSGTGRAWMYSILRYRALKRLRQAARRQYWRRHPRRLRRQRLARWQPAQCAFAPG
jgi:RNA polymerase sigma-70 factor (ECF subfamily)